jgi:hypothetical protein
MVDGSQKHVDVDASSEEVLKARVKALGGKHYHGIAEVLSYEPHSWKQDFVQLGIFTKNLSI